MAKIPKDVNTTTLIYVVKDPDSLEIRYVGKTVQKLTTRLKQHIRAINKEHNHRTNWFNKIICSGKIPLIEEIDRCKWCESQDRETYWIKYYKAQGCDLINSTDGGEGNLGWVQKESTIMKRKETVREKLPKVYQYALDGSLLKEWNSAPEVIETLGLNTVGLARCLRGERKMYAGFMWSFNKEEKTPYSKTQPKGHEGVTHSNLANIIKLEDNLINSSNVFLYENNTLLYEAISLVDMISYCEEHNIYLGNRSSIASYKAAIADYCKTGRLCCNKYKFSYVAPQGHIPKPSYILKLQLFDLKNNLVNEAFGLTAFALSTGISKTNIINNMKGITKTVTKDKQKFYVTWKIVQDLSKIMRT